MFSLRRTIPDVEVTSTQNPDNSNSTPTPTPTQTPTPTVQATPTGTIETSVVENNIWSRTDLLNPTLGTDKADYHPTEIAIITGSGFLTNTEYFLHITSDNLDQVFRIISMIRVIFIYSDQLDGTYRPDYQVDAKNREGQILATTTFYWSTC